MYILAKLQFLQSINL